MSLRISRIALFALSAAVFSSSLAAGHTSSDARARYQKDRAACMSGQTNQDRTTCLQEAGAAYKESRRGGLNSNATDYEQNALARCEPLPPSDRTSCVRRIRGQGVTEGSSMEGGIYRKIVTPK